MGQEPPQSPTKQGEGAPPFPLLYSDRDSPSTPQTVWRLSLGTNSRRLHFADDEPDPTIADLFDRWADLRAPALSANTRAGYGGKRKRILRRWGGHRISEVLRRDVLEWQYQLVKTLSPKTVKDTIGLFHAVLRWSARYGYIESNPIHGGIPWPAGTQGSEMSYWSAAEVEQFLAHHEGSPYYPLYLTAINTGMRLGELAGLQWECVHFDRRQIEVRQSLCTTSRKLKSPKNGRTRWIPMAEPVYEVLLDLYERRDRRTSHVYHTPGSLLLDLQHFTVRHFKPDCAAAGVPSIRFHDLRHTFAAHWMMGGGNIYELSNSRTRNV